MHFDPMMATLVFLGIAVLGTLYIEFFYELRLARLEWTQKMMRRLRRRHKAKDDGTKHDTFFM